MQPIFIYTGLEQNYCFFLFVPAFPFLFRFFIILFLRFLSFKLLSSRFLVLGEVQVLPFRCEPRWYIESSFHTDLQYEGHPMTGKTLIFTILHMVFTVKL